MQISNTYLNRFLSLLAIVVLLGAFLLVPSTGSRFSFVKNHPHSNTAPVELARAAHGDAQCPTNSSSVLNVLWAGSSVISCSQAGSPLSHLPLLSFALFLLLRWAYVIQRAYLRWFRSILTAFQYSSSFGHWFTLLNKRDPLFV